MPASERGTTRDPYLDLLRVVAIGAVVVGHWLATLAPRVHGDPAAWATWAFQVMPVFFLVGGAVNAGSWTRARERGEPWSTWARGRTQRLFTPLVALVVFWALVAPLLAALGFPAELAASASRIAFVPVWFLGVYLAVVALVPWTRAAHERWGLAALVALLVAAAAADLATRRVPLAGEANVLLVWLAIHQLGYFWPRLASGPRALVLVLAGLVALALLVGLAGYPVRMVTLGEPEPSNARPPTLALVALAFAQLGLVHAARAPLTRALARPRAERALAAAGSVLLTVFLWHMSAIVLTGAAAYASGAWPGAPDLAAARWTTSPPWILGALALFAALVLAFRRLEAIPARPAERAPFRTTLGLALTLAATAWIVRHGLLDPWPHSALAALALLAGLAALGALPTIGRSGRGAR